MINKEPKNIINPFYHVKDNLIYRVFIRYYVFEDFKIFSWLWFRHSVYTSLTAALHDAPLDGSYGRGQKN